jgi:hypothetical protein
MDVMSKRDSDKSSQADLNVAANTTKFSALQIVNKASET